MTRFDRPPVHISPNGVSRVNAADILLSRAGQEEIAKAAEAAKRLGLRDR